MRRDEKAYGNDQGLQQILIEKRVGFLGQSVRKRKDVFI